MKPMLKSKTFIYTFILVLIAPAFALAQGGGGDQRGEIEGAQFVIVKGRKITLPPAIRNFEKIPLLPVSKAASQQTYQFKTYNFGLKTLSPSFRPVGLRVNEKQKEISGNYVKVGYGNYSTPFLEAYLGSLRSRDYVFNTYVRHLSSKNGPVFDENSGNSDTEVSLGGKYFNGINTVSGSLNYMGSKVHFYGYNPVLDLPASNIEQKFNGFSAKLGVEKTKKDELGTYHFLTDWSFFRDNLNARENKFAFDLGLGYRPNEKFQLSVQGIAIFSKREDAVETKRNYYSLRPRITYTGDIFSITGGVNLVDDNEDLPTAMDADEGLGIFPYVKLSVNPSASVGLYAGYEGDLEMNTFQGFAQDMPFLQPDFTLYNTEKSSDIFAGVEVELIEGVRLNGGLSIATLKRLPFFTNAITDSTRFEVIYDGGDTDRLNIFSELVYEKPNEIRSSLRFDFYDYTLATLTNPYHRPQFKATAHTTVFPIEKLTVKADLFYLGGLHGLNRAVNVEKELDSIIDLNIQGTYELSPQFGVFMQLNNVFGKEYERFLNYPNRGIQFLAGVSISF